MVYACCRAGDVVPLRCVSPVSPLLLPPLYSSHSVYSRTMLWFSQTSSPIAVGMIRATARRSFVTDPCGNLSHNRGQNSLRASEARGSGYNSAFHFSFPVPPSLGKGCAVVVKRFVGAGTGCSRGPYKKTVHEPPNVPGF